MAVGGGRCVRACAVVWLVLFGCDGPQDAPPPIEMSPSGTAAEEDPLAEEDEPGDEAPQYRVVAGEAGTIEGVVRWRGRRPEIPRLEVHAQHRVCGREQDVPAVEIGRRGGVKGALVHLVGVQAGPRRPARREAELDQEGCRYVPRTVAVMRGQPVVFRNSDAVLHNVHAIWEDGEDWFNVGQPREGMSTRQVPERSGVARVVCDAGHAWMLAWVHVLDHPYFAVTGEEGAFRIEEVPAGEQEVRLWHQGWEVVGHGSGRPRFGDPVLITRSVAVPEGGSVRLELELPPSEEDPASTTAESP